MAAGEARPEAAQALCGAKTGVTCRRTHRQFHFDVREFNTLDDY
jgi:hypothetical protein